MQKYSFLLHNLLSPRLFALISLLLAVGLGNVYAEKLSGTPIGTSISYNYEQSQIINDIQGLAFDGDLNTYFATYDRSYTWVGLDLGQPYLIDQVGWSPRNDILGPKRVQLGIIQGANCSDFMDAVPLHIITAEGVIGAMSYADVNCSKGFRYVRYVSTGDARCNIAELEFYGTPGEGDDSKYVQITNLPTVCINTIDAEEPYDKEHDISANVIIINDNQAYLEKSATVRERGNASRKFPKKPWRIKFDKKQRVLPDAPAQAKKWTLINNYGDKTLMRNILAFEIAKRLKMEYVPYCQAVDVILNGEYKGCYQLCDQVEVNKNRVNITEMKPDDIEGEALTGGYLVEVDGYADQEPDGEWFTTDRTSIPVTIKSPDNGGTPAQYDYIRSFFNALEWSIFYNDVNLDDDSNYRHILDIDSFLRHFLVGELSGNTDTYWSTFMYKDRGNKQILTGPVWDFDIAFDNDKSTYPIHTSAGSNEYLCLTESASAPYSMKLLVENIIRNDLRTKDDIYRILSDARNDDGLTYKDLSDYVNEMSLYLDDSQKLNFIRWPIMDQWIHQNPVISGSYDAEVSRVKTYLKDRFDDLDILIGYKAPISGIEEIESGDSDSNSLRVIESGGTIRSTDGNLIEAYSITGQKLSGPSQELALTAGIYLIRSGARIAKIIIR